MGTLAALEVRNLLKEVRTIGEINLPDFLPANVLARVDRVMQQAGREARNIVATASGRGTKKMNRLTTTSGNTGRSRLSPSKSAARPLLPLGLSNVGDRYRSMTGHCPRF